MSGAQMISLGGGDRLSCPGSELLPLSKFALDQGLGYPQLALPSSRVFVLPEALVCPGSRLVLSRDRRVVAESITPDMINRVEVLNDELNGDPVRLDGTIAVYQSPYPETYHELIDHLPRAALLAQPLIRRLGPVTLVYEGPLSDIEELWLQRLAGPSVKLQRVEAGTPLSAPRVLLPGYVTRPFAGAIPSWYRAWIDREAAAVAKVEPGRGGTRRYFVERLAGGRVVRNRDDLDALLDKFKIQTLSPSSLTAAERIATFRDADLIIGVTGSGLSNVVFSRSAHVVELLAGSKLFPHCYYLTRSKDLPYRYLKALTGERVDPLRNEPQRVEYDEVERLHSDVMVDVDALEDLLVTMEKSGGLPPGRSAEVA